MKTLKLRKFSNLPKVTGIEKCRTVMETQAYIANHPFASQGKCTSSDRRHQWGSLFSHLVVASAAHPGGIQDAASQPLIRTRTDDVIAATFQVGAQLLQQCA